MNVPDEERPSRTEARDLLAPFAAWGAILAFLVVEVYDLDVFWNVAIGRDILGTLRIPAVDLYSAAGLGHPFHDTYWLFEVLLAVAHRAAGWPGVQLLTAAVWGATLWLTSRSISRWLPGAAGSVLLFAAAMASIERFLPRPEIVSFFGIAFFWERFQSGRVRSARDWLSLGAVQIACANGHGLFVIPLFMTACTWAEALLERLRGRPSHPIRLAGLLGFLGLCTFVTPWGPGSWETPLLQLRQVGPWASPLMKGIGELSPTFGPAARSAPAFWFYLGLLCLFGAGVLAGAVRRRLPLARLLIVAALGVASLSGRRNVVLFVLVAAPFVAEQLQPLLSRCKQRSVPLAVASSAAMLAFAWYPLSGRYYLEMEIPARFGLGVTPSFFPHGLPAFLDRIGFQGQVYNSNTIGGFYLFHGFPSRLPLTEGRWGAYEEEDVVAILASPSRPALWEQVLSRYRIEGLLLHHTSPEARALLPRLPADPAWTLLYLDHCASFWLRSSRSGLPAGTGAWAEKELGPPRRVDDGLMLDVFYGLTGMKEQRVRNLERTAAFGWRREALLTALGQLQMERRRWNEAREVFTGLEREFPRNATALGELAYLATLDGDLPEAERLLLRALAVRPGDPELRANLERVRGALRSRPR